MVSSVRQSIIGLLTTCTILSILSSSYARCGCRLNRPTISTNLNLNTTTYRGRTLLNRITKGRSLVQIPHYSQPIRKSESNKQTDVRATGEIRGTVRFLGKLIPAMANIKIPGIGDVTDETWVIKTPGNYVKNAVVYLTKEDSSQDTASSSPLVAASVEINNVRINPHVTVVTPGSPITITNAELNHVNLYFAPATSVAQSLNLLSSGTATINAPRAREFAYDVVTDQAWQRGWIFVSPTPYASITSDGGDFVIKNIPFGVWHLAIWHEGSRDKYYKIGEHTESARIFTMRIKVDAPSINIGDISIVDGK